MSYSVSNAKQDLESILHGTTTNQITNIDGLFNRAARTLLLDLDPQETKRIVQFVSPIFNSVFDYPLAADVKGISVIDIRPQVNRTSLDIYNQLYSQAFDVQKQNFNSLKSDFNINFNTALKSIRINAPFLLPPIILNQADTVAGNGTWATGGTASNINVNSQNYVAGIASLQFNVATGAGYVENSTMTPINLTNNLNQASQFLYVYMPTASQFTDVKLRWGSSASDYYEVTATQTQQGTVFQNGWNLLQFPWLGATVVGTPDVTSISYIRVTYDVTALQTNAGLNNITSVLGNILEYEYYSKYMFRDAITGAFQETVTDDSNLINLDTESYNLFFNLLAHLGTQQQQGLSALFYDGTFFGQQYQDGIQKYKGRYKSEISKPQSLYYRKPNNSYLSWWRYWNN